MEEEEYNSKPPSSAGHHQHRHPPASTTELMESAKLVAAAAKSAFSHDAASIDKARVAEAAEDLLGAAKQYGKLEGSGIGQYLDKAEGYLHNYHSSSHPTASAAHGAEETTAPRPHPHPHPHRRQEEEVEEEESRPAGGGGGGGVGDYIKMAQGFLK